MAKQFSNIRPPNRKKIPHKPPITYDEAVKIADRREASEPDFDREAYFAGLFFNIILPPREERDGN